MTAIFLYQNGLVNVVWFGKIYEEFESFDNAGFPLTKCASLFVIM